MKERTGQMEARQTNKQTALFIYPLFSLFLFDMTRAREATSSSSSAVTVTATVVKGEESSCLSW
ncbi:hypothetical protein BLOT_010041 [Blomia tropicalis]|nr:hypothetical protein BLOT_010041 [Blomia tropicalis]